MAMPFGLLSVGQLAYQFALQGLHLRGLPLSGIHLSRVLEAKDSNGPLKSQKWVSDSTFMALMIVQRVFIDSAF